MARDVGLEALIEADLAGVPDLGIRPMFGGLAWFLNGHLLCAASHHGLLARVGTEREAWALGLPNIDRMLSIGRPMAGWVRARRRAFEDAATRRCLLEAALDFTRSLPPKAGTAKPAASSTRSRPAER